MAHIGDVAHIAHFVAEMSQIAEKYVERDGRTRMSQMAVAIDGGTAYIHAHAPLHERHKQLLPPCERVIDKQILLHHGRIDLVVKPGKDWGDCRCCRCLWGVCAR